MSSSTQYTGFARNALLCLAVLGLRCSDDDPSRRPARHDAGPGRDASLEADSGETSTPAQTRGLADGIVGKPCSANTDCGSGTCQKTISVVNTMYPGGYCSGACRTNDECGAHGVCVPATLGRMGSCYLGCDDDDACRDGYICRVVSDVGRCVPGAKPLPDHVVGNACTSDTDCGGAAMSCAPALGSVQTPGGYCSQSCAIDVDCGAGGRCINGISIPTVFSGICYRSCGSDAPCRSDYECRSLSGSVTDPGVCVSVIENDAGL